MQDFDYHLIIRVSSSTERARVLGLPIRDCERGFNNCVHTLSQMNAMIVTVKNTI